MEFLKAQDKNADPILMDYAIQEAIKTWLPKDNQGNKLHDQIKKKCKEDNDLSSIRFEPKVIAEGIRTLDAFAPASFVRFKDLSRIEDEINFQLYLIKNREDFDRKLPEE